MAWSIEMRPGNSLVCRFVDPAPFASAVEDIMVARDTGQPIESSPRTASRPREEMSGLTSTKPTLSTLRSSSASNLSTRKNARPTVGLNARLRGRANGDAKMGGLCLMQVAQYHGNVTEKIWREVSRSTRQINFGALIRSFLLCIPAQGSAHGAQRIPPHCQGLAASRQIAHASPR